MARQDPTRELDRLWNAMPAMLERDEDWALREVLAAGVAGYTREADTPPGLLVRHDPDGSRALVRVYLDRPDTVVRVL